MAATHEQAAAELPQAILLVDMAKTRGFFTTLDGRGIGVLNVAQRVSELRAHGYPIERDGFAEQPDHNGIKHRVARYVWRGDQVHQGDFWERAE
jgi:hypothetical protein